MPARSPSPAPAPRAFRSAAAFRAWLTKHHAQADELVVRLFKVHAADRGLTYADALDEALCFGWIDGVRRGYDADTFLIRFTPRKPRSIWSKVNVAKVEKLIAAGRMTAAGLAAYRARQAKRTGIYSFERETMPLAPAFLKRFRANAKAWAFYLAQPPWYRRTSSYWVMHAKRPETRLRRFEILLSHSAKGATIPPLTRKK